MRECVRVTPPTGKRPEFTLEIVVAGKVEFLDTLDARREEHRTKILAKIEAKLPAFAEHLDEIDRELIAKGSKWNPEEQTERSPQDSPSSLFDEVEPATEPVDGSALLSELTTAIRRFLVLPDGAAEAVGLWVAHTYTIDAFDFTPRLTISSPVKRCGKTTLLDTLRGACARSVPAVNIRTASLFRLIANYRPTLILDEADNLIVGRDADPEMRGILCAGFRKGEKVIRCVGDDHEPEPFDVFAPVAFGLIGELPDTLADRSIAIEMRRKHPGEFAERVRPSKLVDILRAFRPRLARWASDNLETLETTVPDFPEALGDRERDCWEPLLAIADTVGGDWPVLARSAAIELGGEVEEEGVAGVMLLADIRTTFDKCDADRIKTNSLLAQLNAMDDRPWPTWGRGRDLTARQLGKLLGAFGIKPGTIRLDGSTPKGYRRE